MEKLPVKLLSDLLSGDEIITAENVKNTHEVNFCPFGVALSEESYLALECLCSGERFSDFRYTPRAFFAVKDWETARSNLLKRPEFAESLKIEWYPITASFNSPLRRFMKKYAQIPSLTRLLGKSKILSRIYSSSRNP